ncbi:MAG: DUF4430 domain-containing protein [Syntrophomonadaceae bacterium]|nr:DUF4430 domain-containing protein [Syntrophomonadaceae bacterium]
MRRLLCLMLMILLILICTGCGSEKANDNRNAVVGNTSAVTEEQNDKSNNKTVETAGPEKEEAKEGKDSTVKNAADPSQFSNVMVADEKVTLIVTKDYGAQTLVEKQVAMKKDWTVIDLLESTSKVNTKWDGSFVNSIEGLESDKGGMFGKKTDWFYFINGICADVGASGYDLEAGEVVWWDYHAWKSMGSTNSAVIGCYPEPFIHGYRGKVGPTTIMSSVDKQSLASSLQKALESKGVRSVNIEELNNNLLENRQVPTIVIGTWDELKQLSWLEKFNNAYKKTGTSVHFTDKGVALLDYNGNAAQTIDGSAGIIVAAGSGLGDNSPFWLLAGTDPEGLQQAINVLVNSSGKISKCYGAAVVSGNIIRLPLQ